MASTQAATATTFREAAQPSFELLRTQIGRFEIFGGDNVNTGFWHAANTLNTCIDYLLASGAPPRDPLLPAGLAFFEVTRDKERDPRDWGFWRDDYGWWGRSLLKAYRNAAALGIADTGPYIVGARLCWTGLQAAWDDSVGGGCWNNPKPGDNGPLRQRNSVTNELFWLLSLELAQATGAPDYTRWALAERRWFTQDNVRTLFSPQGLVLEEPTGHQYEDGWVWSGDQGLFAAALLRSNGQPGAVALVETVAQVLCDANGVLNESASSDMNQDVDFATGKGVFCRNASDISPLAQTIVRASAIAAWNNRPDPSTAQFGYDWSGRTEPPPAGALWPITLQTAGQDAFNAMLAQAPDDGIG